MTSLIKIFNIIFTQSSCLSKRSSLILNLLFNDEIITKTKGSELKCNQKINVFNEHKYHRVFKVNLNFIIPEDLIPNQYIIYQSNDNRYYHFGPSSRLHERISDSGEEPYLVEMWTNSEGIVHRDNDYAKVNYKGQRVIGKESFIQGYRNDLGNLPAIIDKSDFSLSELRSEDILRNLYACKMYYINGENVRENGKPKGVFINNRQVGFDFRGRFEFEDENQIIFFIVKSPTDGMMINIEDVIKIIEGFGNVDSEGNDYADRFILKFLERL